MLNNNEITKETIETFDTIANEWFNEMKSMWKASSLVKYMNILKLYLLPEFSGKMVSEITRNDVIEYVNTLLSTGGTNKNGLSSRTVATIIYVLKNIFKYAVKVKGCSLNERDGENIDDYFDIVFRHEKKQLRIMSATEQRKLQNDLFENLTDCNLGILLCMYTGLRIGEICALKWKDVIDDDQCIYIHHTMQRIQTFDSNDRKTKVIITAPKSDSSIRRIPVPDEVYVLLDKYRKGEDAYILTGLEEKYMEPRTMQNHFNSIANKCNIKNVTFHTLRHTFATRCIEIGFDTKSLSEILGHASVNITLNRYVHPSMELKKKNMNMLSGMFNDK